MRTNGSGVTETAEFNIDKEKYDANYVHIFQKDKCGCEECGEMRNKNKENIDADIIK